MLIYLRSALERRTGGGAVVTEQLLMDSIAEGAVQRVRPKAMTVAVIVAGLLPIMLGQGTGSEVMQRIAAPMIGGMVSAPLLSMLVVPAAVAAAAAPRAHCTQAVASGRLRSDTQAIGAMKPGALLARRVRSGRSLL